MQKLMLPLKKFNIFTFPITLIKGRYTKATCKNKAKETTKKYFANSIIELKPWVAKVLEIKQNIPIGAITRDIERTFIITKLKSLKNLVSSFFFEIEIALPRRIAKNITWSIFPFTNDSKGLFGIIFKRTSLIDGGSDIDISFFSIFKLNPSPGLNRFAKISEPVIAKKVVRI